MNCPHCTFPISRFKSARILHERLCLDNPANVNKSPIYAKEA